MNAAERIAAAEQEAADAAALVAALEQRVVDGDETVTAEEIAARRDLVRFAELRVEAARRNEKQAHAEKIRAQLDALGEEALAHARVGDRRLADAAQTAATALVELYDLMAERSQRHRDLSERIQLAHGAAPHELYDRTAIRDLAPGHHFAQGFALDLPDGTHQEYRNVLPMHSVVAVAAAAIEARGAAGQHDAAELHTAMVLDAWHTIGEVPALAPWADWRKTY